MFTLFGVLASLALAAEDKSGCEDLIQNELNQLQVKMEQTEDPALFEALVETLGITLQRLQSRGLSRTSLYASVNLVAQNLGTPTQDHELVEINEDTQSNAEETAEAIEIFLTTLRDLKAPGSLINVITNQVSIGNMDEDHGVHAIRALYKVRDIMTKTEQERADLFALDSPDHFGEPPLTLLISRDHIKLATLLSDAGAYPNMPDQELRSPLHYAVASGDAGLVKTLLSAGADPNALDASLNTPLFFLTRQTSLEILNLLKASGLEFDAKNTFGETALHYARTAEQVDFLLSEGLSIDERDRSGRTPLLTRVKEDDEIAAAALLARGADKHAFDNEGRVALDLAEEFKAYHVIALLRALP